MGARDVAPELAGFCAALRGGGNAAAGWLEHPAVRIRVRRVRGRGSCQAARRRCHYTCHYTVYSDAAYTLYSAIHSPSARGSRSRRHAGHKPGPAMKNHWALRSGEGPEVCSGGKLTARFKTYNDALSSMHNFGARVSPEARRSPAAGVGRVVQCRPNRAESSSGAVFYEL